MIGAIKLATITDPCVNPPGNPFEFLVQTTAAEPRWDVALDPAVGIAHIQSWFPDSSAHAIDYTTQGATAVTQRWYAPYYHSTDQTNRLPQTVRQMLSWNRERYPFVSKFCDGPYNYDGMMARDLVVTAVRMAPKYDFSDTMWEQVNQGLDRTSHGLIGVNRSGGKMAPLSAYGKQVAEAITIRNAAGQALPVSNVYPVMIGQWWQLDISFGPDMYTNPFGYRYAAVEFKPSMRSEVIKYLQLGVIPTHPNTGQPDFSKVDADVGGSDPSKIEITKTGFPLRNGQIEVAIRYPWVRIDSVFAAGPIGVPEQIKTVNANPLIWVKDNRMSIKGNYLGCINADPFLGFPRGYVMYTGAEIEDAQSPVTGKMGYKISHNFTINLSGEWNKTPISQDESTAVVDVDNDGTPLIPRGYMVLMDSKNPGKLYKVDVGGGNASAIYPYAYKPFSDLLYYGILGDGQTWPLEG